MIIACYICGGVEAAALVVGVGWIGVLVCYWKTDRDFLKGRGGLQGGMGFLFRMGMKKVFWDLLAITGAFMKAKQNLTYFLFSGKRKAWGRRLNLNPVGCGHCFWIGRRKDWIHSYQSDGRDEAESVERCPKCRALDLDFMDFYVTRAHFLGTLKNAETERGMVRQGQ